MMMIVDVCSKRHEYGWSRFVCGKTRFFELFYRRTVLVLELCGVRVRDTGFGSKRAHVDVTRRRHRASNLKKNTVVIRNFKLYFGKSNDLKFVFFSNVKESYL